MQLPPQECDLFYKLQPALLMYANQMLGVLSDQPSELQAFLELDPTERLKVRDVLYAEPKVIDQFVAENPFRFDHEELREVAGWKHAVVGDFFILRYLSNHTVFLTADKAPAKAYGVLALRDAFQVHIGFQLPRLITTVLLPFRGKIIYDGIISGFNVTFGGGTKKRLNDDYKEAKERFGIIRTIPLVLLYPSFPFVKPQGRQAVT